MLKGAHCHATLPMKDLEKARAFYEGKLDLAPRAASATTSGSCN
jgi:catechol 2,3-dioxygenase-like lactoylglutathione lyase family enzyme